MICFYLKQKKQKGSLKTIKYTVKSVQERAPNLQLNWEWAGIFCNAAFPKLGYM